MSLMEIKEKLNGIGSTSVKAAQVCFDTIQGRPVLSIAFDLYTRVYNHSADHAVPLEAVLSNCEQLKDQQILKTSKFFSLMEEDLRITQFAIKAKDTCLLSKADEEDELEEIEFVKAKDVDWRFECERPGDHRWLKCVKDLGSPVTEQIALTCDVRVNECYLHPYFHQAGNGRKHRGSTLIDRGVIRIQGRVLLVPKDVT